MLQIKVTYSKLPKIITSWHLANENVDLLPVKRKINKATKCVCNSFVADQNKAAFLSQIP